jgi:hypothetical protein
MKHEPDMFFMLLLMLTAILLLGLAGSGHFESDWGSKMWRWTP